MAPLLQSSFNNVQSNFGPSWSQLTKKNPSRLEVSFERKWSGTNTFTSHLIVYGQSSSVQEEQVLTRLVRRELASKQILSPPAPGKRKVLVYRRRLPQKLTPSPPEGSADARNSRGWISSSSSDLPWITPPLVSKRPDGDVEPRASVEVCTEQDGDDEAIHSERSNSSFGAGPSSQTVESHGEEEREGSRDEMHRTSGWVGRILQEDEAFFIGSGTAKVEAGFTRVEQKQMDLLVERWVEARSGGVKGPQSGSDLSFELI